MLELFEVLTFTVMKDIDVNKISKTHEIVARTYEANTTIEQRAA